MTHRISDYFPGLTALQLDRFSTLGKIYDEWNSRINVISRKDMENFYLHHVLHSLAIAKIISFLPGEKIIDVGTGGGFPGIPLAILFPRSSFTLLDSIGKKIKVVTAIAHELQLDNVFPVRKRMEEENGSYDFAISRAVAEFGELVKLTLKNISPGGRNIMKNGIFCLKGGDLKNELGKYSGRVKISKISDFFSEPYFEEKMVIYLPA